MKQDLSLRRLFNIRVNHVSLVDKAANKKSFLIVKRDESKGVLQVEEIKKYLEEVLGKIEKVLTETNTRLEKLETQESVLFKIDVEKAGAKFSKDTMKELKTLRDNISTLIGEENSEASTTVDAAKSLIDGFEAASKAGSKDDNKDDEAITKLVKAITSALENKED